jgi:DnaJ-class molecular chaperone
MKCPLCDGTGIAEPGDYYDPQIECGWCNGRGVVGFFRWLKGMWYATA